MAAKRDNLANVLVDMMAFVIEAEKCLDQADKLIDANYMGTEKWVREVAAWRKRKAKLIDCEKL